MSSSGALSDVVAEFTGRVDELYGLFLDARMAFTHSRDRLQRILIETTTSGGSRFTFGAGKPEQGEILHSATVGDVLARMADGGKNQTLIAQYLLVLVFQVWEAEYRPRIASAVGVETNDVRVPILGDLRLLRNDTLHHRGVLRAESARKLEELASVVKAGQEIRLDRLQVNDIVRRIYESMDSLEEGYR